ncbi:N-acetylmuramoyl-L-alanine amidase [Streptomyces altiplanensis]
MSYDSQPPTSPPSPTPPRRFGPRTLAVAVAVLAPAALAGWFAWQAMSGPGDSGPTVMPLPDKSRSATATASKPAPTPTTAPTSTPSGPKDDKPDRAGPLTGKVVVIDPGHNPGNFRHTKEINKTVDVGTHRKECDTTGTSTNEGYTEAAFTLDVSRRLRALLEEQGATVTLVQNDDRPYGPCVDERARIGNEAKADAVVSVHADGSAVGNRGFHVILPASVKAGAADTAKIVGPSRELGTRIAGKFVQATGMAPSNYVGDGTALDVREDLGGLNLTTVPKVFVECGNMRDPKDAALLSSGGWRQKAARGISDGIGSYLKG